MNSKTLALALVLVTPAAVASEVRRHVETSIRSGGIRRVVIDIPAGEITIRNGSSGQIAVNGYIEREFDNDDDASYDSQRIVDNIGIEITTSGTEAVIRRTFGAGARSWKARNFTAFDLKIDIPRGLDLQVDTRFGEVEIDGSFGDIDINLRAGEVDIRTPRANVRELSASCRVGEVRTRLGDRVVKREGLFPGRTEFYNASGKSRIDAHVTAGEVDIVLTN